MIGKFNIRASVITKENVKEKKDVVNDKIYAADEESVKVESDKLIVAKESNDAADAKEVEIGEDEMEKCVKR